MKVSDWMSAEVITVTPKTGLSDAWELMRRRRIRHLLVMERQRLLGIISDRDIRLALPSQATSLSAGEITYLLAAVTVDRVMSRSPITIGPDRPLSDAVAAMLAHRIGALPVVGPDGVCGIITQTDVLRAFPSAPGVFHEAVTEHHAPMPAEPSMARVILVPLDRATDPERVLQAACVLAKRASARLRLLHVAHVPEAVVDQEGRTIAFSDQEAGRVEYEVRDDLRMAAAGLRGVAVEFAVRFGEPVDEIVDEAESADVDLIVMATHRRTGVRRLLHGSVAEAVERRTTRPVLLVPYDAETDAGHVPEVGAAGAPPVRA